MNWYNIKVNATESADPSKKFSVQYLVKAETCTDAEKRLVESEDVFYEEFSIESIQRKIYSDVIGGESDKWYMAKIVLITLDKRTGTEKRKNKALLVNADSIEDTLSKVKKHFKNAVMDYEVNGVMETILEDVIDAD